MIRKRTEKNSIRRSTYTEPEETLLLFGSGGESRPVRFRIRYSAKRRRIAIRITDHDLVSLELPLRALKSEGLRFLHAQADWVLAQLQKIESKDEDLNRQNTTPPSGEASLSGQALEDFQKAHKKAARARFMSRTAYYVENYGQLLGRVPSGITIRDQKTRWGSCSSGERLSFNYRLILGPPEVLDYVVVHELCHLRHMNHSKAFWQLVERILPDYRKRQAYLRRYGEYMTPERWQMLPPYED